MNGIIDTAAVLAMLSPDTGIDGDTVADTLQDKRATPYYPGLLAEIARDGITVPVLIQQDENGADWLMDGHHRVTAALDIGLPTVPWTDTDED